MISFEEAIAKLEAQLKQGVKKGIGTYSKLGKGNCGVTGKVVDEDEYLCKTYPEYARKKALIEEQKELLRKQGYVFPEDPEYDEVNGK